MQNNLQLMILAISIIAFNLSSNAIAKRRYLVETELTGFCSLLGYGSASRPVGCRSSGAAIGRVVWQQGDHEAGADVKTSSNGPMIRVLSLHGFAQFWQNQLWLQQQFKHVTGLIVITDHRQQVEPSFEKELCLSDELDYKCQRNDSLALTHGPIPFPVVFLSSRSIEEATHRTMKELQNNSDLWVKLAYTQSQIINAGCLQARRGFFSSLFDKYSRLINSNYRPLCNQVGEVSLAWTVQSIGSNTRRIDRSVMIVITRIDTFSTFYNWGSGASQLQASLSVVLTVISWLANLLKSGKDMLQRDRDVCFIFLSSHGYGRLGGRNLAATFMEAEVKRLKAAWNLPIAPINAEHIHSFIEIGPLGSGEKFNYMTVTNDTNSESNSDDKKADDFMENKSVLSQNLPADSVIKTLIGNLPPHVHDKSHNILLSDKKLSSQGFSDLNFNASAEKLAAAASVLSTIVSKFLLNGTDFIPKIDQLKRRINEITVCFNLGSNCRELHEGQFNVGHHAAKNLHRWMNSGISPSISYGMVYELKRNYGEYSQLFIFLETMLLQITGKKVKSNDCQSKYQSPMRAYPFTATNGTKYCLRSSLIPLDLWNSTVNTDKATVPQTIDADPDKATWVAGSHGYYPTVEFYQQSHHEWLIIILGIVALCLSANGVIGASASLAVETV